MKRLNFERATTEMEANANCIGGFTFDFETLNLDKMTDNEKTTKKWLWKMDWCKKEHLPPAQKWVWDKAEEAYKNIKK